MVHLSELWNLYRQGVAEYEQKRSRNLSGRDRDPYTVRSVKQAEMDGP